MGTAREEYLVALDLGSHRTRCAIACSRPDGELVLEGYAERPSEGVRHGLIIEAPAAASGVREAIASAADTASVRVATIIASMATPYARGLNSRGCIGIEHEDRVVRAPDAKRALRAANRVTLPSDRVVSEVLSQGFAVDDIRGIHDPVGMAGGRLEAEVHVVTDLQAAHENIRHMVRSVRSGLKSCRLERVVFGPAAAAHAVLSDEEKRLGSVHIDVGAGTTSVVLYAGGHPRFSRVLPIGGQHVTNDLAIGLNTSVAAAERLKRRPGLLAARRRRSRGGEASRVQVPAADGSDTRTYPLWRLGFIARARVDEIFELVATELDRSGVPEAACARAVLSGGLSRMDGVLEAARRVLNRPARFGAVEMETTLNQFAPDPAHAVLLGTLYRGMVWRREQLDRRFEEGGWRGMLHKAAGWL
jgi:cell division protein FtsA